MKIRLWATAMRLVALLAAWAAFIACARAEPEPAAEPGRPPRPGLNWVRLPGASSCLSAAELALSVETRLGRSLFVAAHEAQLFVDGYVARGEHAFDVTLEVSEVDGRVLGRRELHFEGDDCEVIEAAITLVIGVTLYPDSALPAAGIALDPATAARLDALFAHESPELDPTTLPAPPPAPAPPAKQDQPTAVRGDAAEGVRALGLTLAAAPTLGLGQLPALAIGVAAYATLRPHGAVPIELGFAYLPPQLTRPEQGTGRASFALLSGSLAVCPVQPEAVPGLDLCIGVEIGQLRVTASDFVFNNQRTSDPVANLRASGVWSVSLAGPLFMRLGLLVSAPLLQRNYTFRSLDNTPVSLFRMPQASVRLDFGLGIAL